MGTITSVQGLTPSVVVDRRARRRPWWQRFVVISSGQCSRGYSIIPFAVDRRRSRSLPIVSRLYSSTSVRTRLALVALLPKTVPQKPTCSLFSTSALLRFLISPAVGCLSFDDPRPPASHHIAFGTRSSSINRSCCEPRIKPA